RSVGPRAQCELCGAAIVDEHPHVFERAHRAIRCSCGACGVLFRDAGAAGGRYRTIPNRVLELVPFSPRPEDWLRLGLRVEVVLLVPRDGWVAIYPSPAGAVEAELSEEAAQALAELIPRSRRIERDVEALLLRRTRTGETRGFVVPIVTCYELVD